ncbi:2-amino-5-chlorophenol 1,6-dioxygenase subunit alpha [Euzebya tangerina]|uniref:DODA-type extradiol aromatic ring-opening family dioxygenase n=1 Tax=Euzebya tangerina TaxID=591198 RepID=UPI000E31556D|nr:2-amino-5-chlorophenol 1,6-dioxygenase subunit alpha [Euzebya tangerina]
MTEGHIVGAAYLPGMPHLLAEGSDASPGWVELRRAVEEVGQRLAAAKPDVVLTLSTQWFTVLGHQVQLDPNPTGHHVDENWYDYDFGHLDYDLPMDVELATAWADEIDDAGLQARRTRYEGFPIDVGTIVARNLADPDSRLPGAQVSCNLYAPAEVMGQLASLGVRAAGAQGKRVALVVVSGLSAGLIQQWITPEQDHILSPDHDRWNRRVLDLLVQGRGSDVMAVREAWAREAVADSQGRGLAFLAGTGILDTPADLLAYAPVWGTGGAVLHWGLP